MKQIITVVALTLALLVYSVNWAEAAGTAEQVGAGAGSAFGTLVYAPIKGATCILGGIGGGFTLVVAGAETANKVVSTTCKGTWVITPNMVRGNEPIHFTGR